MGNQERYESFLKRVDSLDSGSRVALKRSAGIMISQADAKAIAAFYRCISPAVPQWQEDRWFAVACIKCLWDPVVGPGEPVEDVLANLTRSAELSDSMQHSIEELLDTAWDQDGYMLTKLCRLTKMLRQKAPKELDFAALLEDMIYWNNENQSVQRKWARAIFSDADM